MNNKKIVAIRDGIILIVICAIFAVIAIALNKSNSGQIDIERLTTVQETIEEESTE